MRPLVLCVAGVMAFGVMALSEVACSQNTETVEAADASIGIQTSQLFVTIENKSGAPLLDLRVAIQTSSAPYTYLVTRLESREKRDVSLSSFSSRDGTSFNLRLAKPRTVEVSATDLTNKKYESRVAWK